MKPRRPPLLGFADVRPDALYTLDQCSPLLGKSTCTLLRWIRVGKLKPVPRVGTHAVLGSELLRLLGGQTVVPPRPSETAAERSKRAEADRLEILRLVKGRG